MHMTVKTERFDATPAEWLPVGGWAGELANYWSGRGDIIAYVGEGAGMGMAAALWNPILCEMELAREPAFGEGAKPEFIGDLTVRDNQFEQPVACGAILHEAGHAKHTKFDFAEVRSYPDKRIAMLVEMFEETRIEQRMAAKWPENRSFLRSCALSLVVADMKQAGEEAETASALQLSRLMLLTMARVTAGVLEPVDVEPIAKAAEKVFGTALVDQLQLLWVEAQAHAVDHEWWQLRSVAERWLKALEDAGHKTEPTEAELRSAIEKAISEAIGEIGEAMGGMVDTVIIRARAEGIEQAEAEEDARQVEAANAQEREDGDAKRESDNVFGGAGTRDMVADTKSKCTRERPPTDDERGAATRVAKMLEKAKYQDRVVERRNQQMPPGRLRSRAMVQRSALRARGAIDTTQLWAQIRRYHVEDPKLKLGVMTDVSGSMKRAMESMAVTNWMWSEVARRIEAWAASVYFGNDVFPGLSPGEHVDKVRVFSAADGTERFDRGFKALNGKLHLLNSTGARLLVVVSDLHHTEKEVQAERKWFERCAAEGVAVLVMPFGSPYLKTEATEGLPVRVLKDVSNPVEAAMEIGWAAAEVLTAAGGNR